MFGIPFFLLSDREQARMRAQEKAERARRTAAAVPWTPDMKWSRELNIIATTYNPHTLIDTPYFKGNDPNLATAANSAVSADGRWLYVNKQLPGGSRLATFQGSRQGTVMFDGYVNIPCLHERWGHANDGAWREEPFMSITPMEILSLRPGTKLAKGHVILGGLGLGHQLIEVSRKKSVEKITVIEKSADLVDFLWDKIKPRLWREAEIIVDDAIKAVPKMSADVALIDIFPHYGGNRFPRCPNIKRVWCWGSAGIGDDT